MKQLITALVISAFSMTTFAADYLAKGRFNSAKTNPEVAVLKLIQRELAKSDSKLIFDIELTLVVERENLVSVEKNDIVLLSSSTSGANKVSQEYMIPLRFAWKSSVTTAGFLMAYVHFTDEGAGTVTLERVIQVPDLNE